MTPYELQIETLRGYMEFYSLRTWLKYIFTFRFTKQLLFHGWGMVIIRNWRRDERNKAFIATLKRMWPRPTPQGQVHGAGRRRRCRQIASLGRKSDRERLSAAGQDGRVSP